MVNGVSVPKKSHLFDIKQPKGSLIHTNLEDWIKNTFLQAEKSMKSKKLFYPKRKKRLLLTDLEPAIAP
jgi:hypothetical protein